MFENGLIVNKDILFKIIKDELEADPFEVKLARVMLKNGISFADAHNIFSQKSFKIEIPEHITLKILNAIKDIEIGLIKP